MTETLSLRAKIEQSPMGAYQWMIVVMAAIMNLLDGFDVLALAFTATAIRGEFGLTGIECRLVWYDCRITFSCTTCG